MVFWYTEGMKNLLLFLILLSVSVAANATTVVKNYVVLGQTTPLPNTALYTPTVSGAYVVHIIMERAVPGNVFSDPVAPYIEWTDDNNHVHSVYSTTGAGLNQSQEPNAIFGATSMLIRVKAGTTISVSTIQSNPTVSAYDIYVLVERF